MWGVQLRRSRLRTVGTCLARVRASAHPTVNGRQPSVRLLWMLVWAINFATSVRRALLALVPSQELTRTTPRRAARSSWFRPVTGPTHYFSGGGRGLSPHGESDG